jgi:RNA polymerase sigma factor (TIGR02999 family)
MLLPMSDVTRVLSAIQAGNPQAAAALLPLVYDELRKLAAARLAKEQAGQNLEATALVHEAYVRLVDRDQQQQWDNRGHFFAAASEAMRRIIIEEARSRLSQKRGGGLQRLDIEHLDHLATRTPPEELLAINEALKKLELEDQQAAKLVKLRFFAGLSLTEAADLLGISRTSAYEQWTYARAWLKCAVEEGAS